MVHRQEVDVLDRKQCLELLQSVRVRPSTTRPWPQSVSRYPDSCGSVLVLTVPLLLQPRSWA